MDPDFGEFMTFEQLFCYPTQHFPGAALGRDDSGPLKWRRDGHPAGSRRGTRRSERGGRRWTVQAANNSHLLDSRQPSQPNR